jgi:hypothetical protein
MKKNTPNRIAKNAVPALTPIPTFAPVGRPPGNPKPALVAVDAKDEDVVGDVPDEVVEGNGLERVVMLEDVLVTGAALIHQFVTILSVLSHRIGIPWAWTVRNVPEAGTVVVRLPIGAVIDQIFVIVSPGETV